MVSLTPPTAARTARAAKKALTPDEKKPTAVLAGIAIGYILLITLVWVGIGKFAATRAIVDARHQATEWSNQLSQHFVFTQQTFKTGKLQTYDKALFKRIPRDKSIFRYMLLKLDGTVFWSSRKSLIGTKLDTPLIRQVEASGETQTATRVVPSKQIEGLNLTFRDNSRPLRATQRVTEVAVPVFYKKKQVGTFVGYSNVTWKTEMMTGNAKRIAAIITVILGLIFAGIAFLVWSFAKARARQLIKLEKSRREAVELSDQLQSMNEDIVILNKDLSRNIKVLRETQDKVIRKGKMAQLGQLTATVAHDIRNPLGTVRTSAFLLRRKFIKDNPKMEKPLERIEKGVNRCDAIISELLDFARSKTLSAQLRNLDDWLISLLKEQLPALPAEITIEFHPGLGDTETAFDPDSLSRAIINFLTNASEAMVGKGGDAPAKPTTNPKIIISTRRTERGTEISVKDNGPGISAENLEKIRDPLFTTKAYGVGLGLPAIENIFEQHKGGLDIHSVAGKGAELIGWISPDLDQLASAKASDKADGQHAA